MGDVAIAAAAVRSAAVRVRIGDTLIERTGEQHRLSSARVTGNSDMVGVYMLEHTERIDAAHVRPCPCRNGGKLTVGVERVNTEVAVGIVHVGSKLGTVEVCNGVASAMSLLEHRTVAVEPAAVARENNGITVVIVLVVDVSGIIDMENKGDRVLLGSRCDAVGIKARSEALTHVVKAKIFRLRRHSAVLDVDDLGQIFSPSLLPVGGGLDLAAVLQPQQLGKRTIENIVFVHNFILSVYVCLYIDRFTVLFSAVPYGTSHCLRQITARADNRAAHGLPHLFHRDRSI